MIVITILHTRSSINVDHSVEIKSLIKLQTRDLRTGGEFKYDGTDMQSSIWKVISVCKPLMTSFPPSPLRSPLFAKGRKGISLVQSLEFHLSSLPSDAFIGRSTNFIPLHRAFRRVVFRRVITIIPLGISPSVDQHRWLLTLASERPLSYVNA